MFYDIENELTYFLMLYSANLYADALMNTSLELEERKITLEEYLRDFNTENLESLKFQFKDENLHILEEFFEGQEHARAEIFDPILILDSLSAVHIAEVKNIITLA